MLVSRGQQVKVGDVLILLAAGEGSELKDLQTQLDDAQHPYTQKTINMGGGSSEAGDFLLDACHTTLARLHANPQPTLRLAAHRNTAGIIGGVIASLKLGVTMH